MKKFYLLLTLIILFGWFQNPSIAQIADTIWSNYQHNNQRTGQSEYAGPEVPVLEWEFNLYSYTSTSWNQSSPVIGNNGEIYISATKSDNSGILYALNPNGSQKWHFNTNFRMDSVSPSIGTDGTIYVYSNNSKDLYAILPNGSLKWKMKVIVDSPITISNDGSLIFATHDGHEYYLVAINPDRTLKWYHPLTSNLYGSPAQGSDGTIYISPIKGDLTALNSDGTLLWKFETGTGYCSSTPSIGSDGTIYCRFSLENLSDSGSNLSYLYAINPDGSEKWRFFTDDDIVHTPPAIGLDGTVYTYSVSLDSYLNYLVAIHPDGYQIWSYELSNIPLPPPIVDSKGIVYTHTLYDHNLYAINPDGSKKWQSDLISGIISNQSSLTIGKNGTIYACTLDNVLYALGDETLLNNPSVEENMKLNPSSGDNSVQPQYLTWAPIYKLEKRPITAGPSTLYIMMAPFLTWGPIYKYEIPRIESFIILIKWDFTTANSFVSTQIYPRN